MWIPGGISRAKELAYNKRAIALLLARAIIRAAYQIIAIIHWIKET